MPAAPSTVAAPPTDDTPVRRRRDWTYEAIALGVVAFVFALPLRGLFRAPGPPMEEGFMLVFPERVLHGDIPNRDFLHLYGPGSLWALASAMKVFGVSLITERVFGMFQQILIVFGVYVISRRWNRTLATVCAVTSALIIMPFGLSALAWVGAVGLALIAIAAGIQARVDNSDPNGRRWAIVAGVLFGAALLFRPDLILGVALAMVALWSMERARRKRMLIGIAAMLSLYIVHVAMAGLGNSARGMILDPVFNLRGGRSLPVPPSWTQLDGFLQRAGNLQLLRWPIPSLHASAQLFVWFFLLLGVIAFLLWQGVVGISSEPDSVRARSLLVVAMFSAGILPQALQRVDSAHFGWVGCVPFGFLPVAGYEFLRFRSARIRVFAPMAITLAMVLFVFPAFTIRRYADYSLQTFNRHRSSYAIRNEGRTFYYGKPDRAAAAQLVISEAERISKPGQRLFVGPVNLRKTAYSDAYLYFMLPKLKPATYYIEMDPMDTKPHSRLASDLRSADIVILSAIWDNWDEPNDSRKLGSDEAEQELHRDFCQVGTYLDLYQLWRRC